MTQPTRSPETEHAAANMRQLRVLYAQRLRDTRHAVSTGNPRAAERLKALRASPCPVPNPDRRADCARHATRAQEVYNEVAAALDIDGPDAAEILNMAARQADLFAILQLTARY